MRLHTKTRFTGEWNASSVVFFSLFLSPPHPRPELFAVKEEAPCGVGDLGLPCGLVVAAAAVVQHGQVLVVGDERHQALAEAGA